MNFEGEVAIVAVTEKAMRLGAHLAQRLNATLFIPEKLAQLADSLRESGTNFVAYPGALSQLIPQIFHRYSGFVFVMALGIVIRVIGPLAQSKYTDPAVVVLDESTRYVISALSGHERGANKLAYLISSLTGAAPVITTATEANKIYLCGVGCRKNTPAKEIVEAIIQACQSADIQTNDLQCIASAWIKKDEQGLIEAAKQLNAHVRFIPQWMFAFANGAYPESDFVHSKIGVGGVCEPCALLAGRHATLILNKQIIGNVTVAIAKEQGLWGNVD
jgi:cobalt-precorrin 5A hydrolase